MDSFGLFSHSYLSIDGSKFKAVNSKDNNFTLAVGRLNDWHYKGFDLLLKAWHCIGKEHPDWYLRIVGHGDEEAVSYLKSLAACIPNIEFKSHTPNIREEYQKASVFVLSSRYEGFGLVLTEAMSQGCDCIACDYKGRQSW